MDQFVLIFQWFTHNPQNCLSFDKFWPNGTMLLYCFNSILRPRLNISILISIKFWIPLDLFDRIYIKPCLYGIILLTYHNVFILILYLETCNQSAGVLLHRNKQLFHNLFLLNFCCLPKLKFYLTFFFEKLSIF